MRSLIFGGGGMLGRALVREARGRGWPALALPRAQADITDAERLRAYAAAFRPQIVWNCAAFTRVDESESRREHALQVNGRAVANAVEAARSCGARLVQVSTDYVFDGAATAPYTEDAPTRPLQVYGESKLRGEEEAARSPGALIVRTSWVFGAGGNNFVATILRLLAQAGATGAPLRVVADQVGCPTYAPFLARALCDLAAAGAHGLVHYRNREPVSWHAFAQAIADEGCAQVEIVPITTPEYPLPAPRPAYSVLDVSRCELLLGRRVEEWAWGLASYVDLERRRTA